MDHLFCLTQAIKNKIAVNQEVHLLYVDLKKANDSVPLSKLWDALHKTNINVNLIEAVKNLYQNTTAKIKMGTRILEGIVTESI